MASATPFHLRAPVRPGLAGVGERLREMFELMTAGPAPAHLIDLIDQLEAQAGPGRPADGATAADLTRA